MGVIILTFEPCTSQFTDVAATFTGLIKAIETFRMAVDFRWYMDFESVNMRPIKAGYARLYDDPRMVNQLARMKAIRDEQRSNIEAMLAPHDLDELLAPLMTMEVVPERISHGHEKD